jgi:threonine/homoserine/homoserine lactone efflux protein
MKSFDILSDGFKTGLILQFAIGPVFFFLADLSIHHGFAYGFPGALAVTLVDLIYIALAMAGIGALLKKRGVEPYLRVIGSLVLGVFGLLYVLGALGLDPAALFASSNASNGNSAGSMADSGSGIQSPLAAFAATFVLTISSPMTILFWTGLFSAKISERGYSRANLYVFGAGALLCTLFFMTLAVFAFSLVGAVIPPLVARILNGAVGAVLVVYAVIRLRPKKAQAA